MIELNAFKRQWGEIGSDVQRAIERVGQSGRYILGPEVEKFERALAQFWGIRHAVGVGNGMDAIEISLRCLGLQRGQKVLTTPFSAFATTLAILRAGGVPVYVDVDDNGNIDLDQSGDVFARDDSIRFFVPVHLYGNPLDLEKLAALKRDYGLLVVEDCAQAIGASFAGRQVGTVGDAAALSLYPTKNLGALGDAGALLTNDAAVADHARALRNYGQSRHYLHDHCGLNSRLDELQAAILHEALLPRLRQWTGSRRATAAQYLASSLGADLRPLRARGAAEPVWHLFPVFTAAGAREYLRSELQARGVQTSVHYPRIIPDQPAMITVRSDNFAELRNARTLAETELSLPIHSFLTEAEREQVIAACAARRERVAEGAAP